MSYDESLILRNKFRKCLVEFIYVMNNYYCLTVLNCSTLAKCLYKITFKLFMYLTMQKVKPLIRIRIKWMRIRNPAPIPLHFFDNDLPGCLAGGGLEDVSGAEDGDINPHGGTSGTVEVRSVLRQSTRTQIPWSENESIRREKKSASTILCRLLICVYVYYVCILYRYILYMHTILNLCRKLEIFLKNNSPTPVL